MSAAKAEDKLSNTEQVIALIDQLTEAMNDAIGDIRKINGNTKLLALNARIEATRSGTSGAAFGVVAQEMQTLSGRTAIVADYLSNQTNRWQGLLRRSGRCARLRNLLDRLASRFDARSLGFS